MCFLKTTSRFELLDLRFGGVVAGLKRAKRQGKTLGRPKAIVDREKIRAARATGLSLRQIGAQFGISRTLVMNLLSASRDRLHQ